MNDQSNSSQFKSFGEPPPAPSGLRHLAPWVKVIAGGGVAAAVTFYALQVALPDGWRPSSVAGDAAGDTVRHEIEAMKEAKIDMERRLADATAQANAKAQADIIAIQVAASERTANLAGESGMATLADIACIGARFVSALTQPQGWGRSSTDDVYYASQKTGAATCGVSNFLRQDITRSQLDAIRQVAAERGAPVNDGAVRTVSTPIEPVPKPRQVQPINDDTDAQALPAAQTNGSRLTAIQQGQLRIYSYRMPPTVLDKIAQGLDMHQGYPDAWYVRVASYRTAHGG